jgi:hypothetical protein
MKLAEPYPRRPGHTGIRRILARRSPWSALSRRIATKFNQTVGHIVGLVDFYTHPTAARAGSNPLVRSQSSGWPLSALNCRYSRTQRTPRIAPHRTFAPTASDGTVGSDLAVRPQSRQWPAGTASPASHPVAMPGAELGNRPAAGCRAVQSATWLSHRLPGCGPTSGAQSTALSQRGGSICLRPSGAADCRQFEQYARKTRAARAAHF